MSDLEDALDHDYGRDHLDHSEEESHKDILPHGNDNGLAVSPVTSFT